jgi:hypothetical protein
MLGCMRRWFAGRWYTSAAVDYMSIVQGHVNGKTWLTRDFLNYNPELPRVLARVFERRASVAGAP